VGLAPRVGSIPTFGIDLIFGSELKQAPNLSILAPLRADVFSCGRRSAVRFNG